MILPRFIQYSKPGPELPEKWSESELPEKRLPENSRSELPEKCFYHNVMWPYTITGNVYDSTNFVLLQYFINLVGSIQCILCTVQYTLVSQHSPWSALLATHVPEGSVSFYRDFYRTKIYIYAPGYPGNDVINIYGHISKKRKTVRFKCISLLEFILSRFRCTLERKRERRCVIFCKVAQRNHLNAELGCKCIHGL